MDLEMRLARHADERTISLQRQSRIDAYTPIAGHEGTQIGSVHALEPDDWFVPSYRAHGAKMAPRMDQRDVFRYWMGSDIGDEITKESNIMPIIIAVRVH